MATQMHNYNSNSITDITLTTVSQKRLKKTRLFMATQNKSSSGPVKWHSI